MDIQNVKDRVGNDLKEGDFVVYVTAGDRHPVLEFGWVLGFHETKSWNGPSGNFKIKLQRSTPEGKRQTKQAVERPGHWREDTPEEIITARNPDGSYRNRTSEEWNEYYVEATYRDTGKPDTTMLDVHEGNNNRLMVTKPV